MGKPECKICGKPAQRRFTEVVGGRRRTMSLCLECARRQELSPPDLPPAPPAAKLKFQATLRASALPSSPLRCPECGVRLVDLRKAGRVGCANCYEVFRKQILPLLKRVHGSTEHCGTRPAGETAGESGLPRLREELRRAIEAENFEQAAELRDRLTREAPEAGGEAGEDRE